MLDRVIKIGFFEYVIKLLGKSAKNGLKIISSFFPKIHIRNNLWFSKIVHQGFRYFDPSLFATTKMMNDDFLLFIVKKNLPANYPFQCFSERIIQVGIRRYIKIGTYVWQQYLYVEVKYVFCKVEFHYMIFYSWNTSLCDHFYFSFFLFWWFFSNTPSFFVVCNKQNLLNLFFSL